MPEEPTLPLIDELATQAGRPGSVGAPSAAWGSFTLLARVGAGGFGEVYRAFDPHLQREVALKLLLPGVAGSEGEYDAMLREARALASVRHPNIVPVYGIDRHDGRVGFWTDFVHGKTLSTLVSEQGRFGAREAALICLDVARALSAVHRAGILHRDIKAENVMREEGGRILLMDFGLSSLQQPQGDVAGTPNYMAPELFEGGDATVASDIYAMGVLLYFLVAGDYPARLTGLRANEARERLAKRRPLMDVRPEIAEGLLRTVSTATELDAAKRFKSAGELAESLTASLGEASQPPAHANANSGTSTNSVEASRRRRRVRMLSGAVAAVVAIAAISVVVVLRSGHGTAAMGRGASEVSSTSYEEFQKAQDLLQRSYKNANTAAAVEGFQRVLKADPEFALAHAGLGTAYFIQYRDNHDPNLLDEAKASTSRAIQLDKNLAPPYVTLARMAAMQGENSLAMQQAQKALSLDPRSAEAYGALAEVYEAEGKTAEAKTTFQKAVDLAPDDWRWPVRLGAVEFQAGDVAGAQKQWKRGVQLAPDNAIAYYDLGVADMQLDRISDARKDLEAALKIEPDASAYAALGSVALLEGQYGDAAAMERKSIELNANDYEAWGNLGVAYTWSGGHHSEAMEAFKKAVALGEAERAKSSEDPQLLASLANDYASMGETDKSLTLVRQALALDAESADVQYKCGEAYETLGQRTKAIPLMARALAAGYSWFEFEHNPELAALRATPEWAQALAAEQRKKK